MVFQVYIKDENLELILNKFNQTLKNRGPDYASIYLDKKFFLAWATLDCQY